IALREARRQIVLVVLQRRLQHRNAIGSQRRPKAITAQGIRIVVRGQTRKIRYSPAHLHKMPSVRPGNHVVEAEAVSRVLSVVLSRTAGEVSVYIDLWRIHHIRIRGAPALAYQEVLVNQYRG